MGLRLLAGIATYGPGLWGNLPGRILKQNSCHGQWACHACQVLTADRLGSAPTVGVMLPALAMSLRSSASRSRRVTQEFNLAGVADLAVLFALATFVTHVKTATGM